MGCHLKVKARNANRLDPDETAHYEPSQLDLHCLQRYIIWSTMLKELKTRRIWVNLCLSQQIAVHIPDVQICSIIGNTFDSSCNFDFIWGTLITFILLFTQLTTNIK